MKETRPNTDHRMGVCIKDLRNETKINSEFPKESLFFQLHTEFYIIFF
jgi:hypothetical protein